MKKGNITALPQSRESGMAETKSRVEKKESKKGLWRRDRRYKKIRPKTLANSLSHPFHSTKPQVFTHNNLSYVLLAHLKYFTLISGETGRHICTISLPKKYLLLSICYSQNSIWLGCNGDTWNKDGDGRILEYNLEDLLLKGSAISAKFTCWSIPKSLFMDEGDKEKDNFELKKKVTTTQGNANKNKKSGIKSKNFRTKHRKKHLQEKTPTNDICHIIAPHSCYHHVKENQRHRVLFATLHCGQNEAQKSRIVRFHIPMQPDSKGMNNDGDNVIKLQAKIMGEIRSSDKGEILSILALPSGNVLIAKKAMLYLINEDTGNTTRVMVTDFRKNYTTESKYTKKKNPDGDNFEELITCMSACPGGNDLAIGFTNGRIRIFLNFFREIQYLEQKVTNKELMLGELHVFQHRVLHWHKHPVNTLTYLNHNLLLSGGEEAVMLHWQVGYTSTGGGTMSKRPINTLPRLFRGSGGVSNLIPLDSTRVFAISEGENAMKMISTHDNKILWCIGGLAFNYKLAKFLKDEVQIYPKLFLDQQSRKLTSLSNYGGDKHFPLLTTCPTSHQPILSGLNGAPGFLHKLSSASSSNPPDFGFHSISSALEIAAYNRVSRNQTGYYAKSSLIPRVSFFDFSSDGKILVTVDNFLSELDDLGRKVKVMNDILSETTSLKFWMITDDSAKGMCMPYKLNAVMSNPHGRAHNISGIALTRRGSRLVTMSSTEDSFRLWALDNEKAEKDSLGEWKCKYSISTPLSLKTQNVSGAMALNPVSDNEEESILAVAYGKKIGLWDISTKRDYPMLLRTISHNVAGLYNDPIVEKLIFAKGNGSEKIISVSSFGIHAQSIFPGIFNGSWLYSQPVATKERKKITAVEYIPSQNEIAFATTDEINGNWVIDILDESDGKRLRTWGTIKTDKKQIKPKIHPTNHIISMKADTSGKILYFVTDSCKLFSLTRKNSKTENVSIVGGGEHKDNTIVPKLSMPSTSIGRPTKRVRLDLALDDEGGTKDRSWSRGVDSSNLPLLRGPFFRSVLGSKLKRVVISDEENNLEFEEDLSSDSDEESDSESNDAHTYDDNSIE